MQLQTLEEFRQFAAMAGEDQQATVKAIVAAAATCFDTRSHVTTRLTALERELFIAVTGIQIGDTLLWVNGLVQEQGVVVDVIVQYATTDYTTPNDAAFKCCWKCRVTAPAASTGNSRFDMMVLVTPSMSPVLYKRIDDAPTMPEWLTPDPDSYQKDALT